MGWDAEVEEIRRRRTLAAGMGGAEGLARQRAKGYLDIRQRIAGLVDADSFRELGPAAGATEPDGGFTPANFLLGFAELNGRPCIVGGEDFTVRGGSPNPAGLRKSTYIEDLACHYRIPLVRLHQGGGGSVTGAGGKGASGPVGGSVAERPRFHSLARTLAMVPVATAALGAVAGLPAARLVASHFAVMTEASQILVAGPAVVERALGEDMSKEELGGPEIHAKNGVVDAVAPDEAGAFELIRRFLSYLPQNVWSLAEDDDLGDDPDRREEKLIRVVPRNRRIAFDMREVIAAIVDGGVFFELMRAYGPGQIVGFARLAGQAIGLLSNDSRYYAGAMTADGARKVRRLIEICDTFHLPVVSLVDEPGFMLGEAAERLGTIRPGTSAVLAAAECTAPWASVIVRKSYGVAGAAHYGPDAYVLAWPSAEMGPLPLEGGVAVAFRREIAAADDPDAMRQELEAAMAARLSPFPREDSFALHAVIDPRETRPALCEWIGRIRPLLPSLAGPCRFGFRP